MRTLSLKSRAAPAAFALRVAVLLALAVVPLSTPHAAGKRVALVIGNGAYDHATPLANPVNDARALEGALERLGYEVIARTDLDTRGFGEALRDFAAALEGADTGLFFYAGHGLQVDGRNYLASVDARLEDRTALLFEALRLDDVLTVMEARVRTRLVFLDACRNNPLASRLARSFGTRSAAVGRGLARVQAGSGTLIAYATAPGEVAQDGAGRHSPFTAGLLEHIESPGLDIAQMLRRVRVSVQRATGGAQVPWNSESLTGDYYFVPAVPEPDIAESQPQSGIDLDSLMNECHAHEKANRLTLGAAGNALDCYREVLSAERGHIEALAGIARIEVAYADLARQALARGDVISAERNLERLRSLNVEHPELRRLVMDVDELRTSQKVADRESTRLPKVARVEPRDNAPEGGAPGSMWEGAHLSSYGGELSLRFVFLGPVGGSSTARLEIGGRMWHFFGCESEVVLRPRGNRRFEFSMPDGHDCEDFFNAGTLEFTAPADVANEFKLVSRVSFKAAYVTMRRVSQ